ncbi:MAG: alpha/beta fold hydrolase [bacterium]|nr:alpha/beta fold hydrolase [bacterium]
MKTSKGEKFFGSVIHAAFFVGFLFFPWTAFAATNVSGTISQNTTWTVASSPYIAIGSVTVGSGVTLTLEAGTIVKFKDGVLFNINGTLRVNGAVDNKVYLTSFKDDFVGGDSNGDGFLSLPAPRDWRGVQFNAGAVGNIDGAVIQYAGNSVVFGSGVSGIYNTGGAVSVAGSLISKNGNYGIFQTAGSLALSDSDVSNHSSYGIRVDGGSAVINHNLLHDNTLYGLYAPGSITDLTLMDNTFTNNQNAVLVPLRANFVHSGNTASGGNFNGLVILGALTTNQTWNPDTMPYIVSQLIINAGKTLTINPGSILKFDPAGFVSITVDGSLVVAGDPDNQVYFTSFKDDSVGGDTNADGGASVPTSLDWRDIRFNVGSSGTLSNAVVRYAGNRIMTGSSNAGIYNLGGTVSLTGMTLEKNGSYGIHQKSGSLVVTSTEISNEDYGLYVFGGTVSAHGSSFHDNKFFAIYNGTAGNVDAINNWWGDASGPTVATNPAGHGQRITAKVLYDPWMVKNSSKHTPVILIPGILGTEMKKGDDLLWMDLGRMAFDAGDTFMDPLMLNADGTAVDGGVVVGDVVRVVNLGPTQFNIYGDLIKEFQLLGFIENQDLFFFPYDWRLDNKINSQKLKEKIDAVLAQTGSQKVNLVAHSMGGLVAKQYVIDNGEATVDKLVFVGTPNLGAPKAFKALLVGDTFGVPLVLDPLELKKIARNMPSAYQLLPSPEYFSQFGGYFIDGGQNPLDYISTKNYLLVHDSNSALHQLAEQFHSSALDRFDAPNIDTYNIVGCNSPTVGRITHRQADEYDLQEVTGDGTVPFNSALAVKVKNRFYVTDAKHARMPSQDGIRQLIAQIVTESVNPSALPVNTYADPSLCHLRNGKLISVHSPVDLHAYDADGNHVGVSENGVIDVDIPGAVYEDIEHNKFIFLPEDAGQIYSVSLDATAVGTFSFRVADVVNDVVERSVYYHDVDIVPASAGQITIDAESEDTVMRFDAMGTNDFITLQASSVLTAEESTDFTKPNTTISIAGKSGDDGWYMSSVVVTLAVSDDNSGVLSTQYSRDGGISWINYTGPFTIAEEGLSTLLYYSVDNAGNVEASAQSMINIDITPPEAMLVFDPVKKDISISGNDNLSSVVASDLGTSFMLTDAAGNTTTLVFAEKNRRWSLHANLTEIWYNGIKARPMLKNKFIFEWRYDKQDHLQELIQRIKSGRDFSVHSEYSVQSDITQIHDENLGVGKKKRRINGLVLFKIVTDKGVLNYSY